MIGTLASTMKHAATHTLLPWHDVICPEAIESMRLTDQCSKPCFVSTVPVCSEAEEWDRHWQSLDTSVRGWLFSQYRQQIRSRCVSAYLARHFTAPGIYVECGCGSGETSCRVRRRADQLFLALDFARRPLAMALTQPCMSGGVQADLRCLPFRDQSLNGLWNLGVMEHFEEDEQLLILREFRRVLKPGGKAILWWPPVGGMDRRLLGWMGWPFPSEPGRVSALQARDRLTMSGFREISIQFPITDCWTELAIVAYA